jgi:hypothetical protein
VIGVLNNIVDVFADLAGQKRLKGNQRRGVAEAIAVPPVILERRDQYHRSDLLCCIRRRNVEVFNFFVDLTEPLSDRIELIVELLKSRLRFFFALAPKASDHVSHSASISGVGFFRTHARSLGIDRTVFADFMGVTRLLIHWFGYNGSLPSSIAGQPTLSPTHFPSLRTYLCPG